jgi:transcription elongation factor GreA
MNEQFLTREGLDELSNKLHELKTVRRREIAEAIHAAKEQGDLSENAEYTQAKEEQQRIEEQIAELEMTVKHAQVIQKIKTDEVSLGSTVTLRCDEREQSYQIVGSNEVDPLKGKISNESPMGRALLGQKQGTKIEIPTPAGSKECEIIKIG